jgi:hypothetical protein
MSKTVAVDFDATISEYYGWTGPFKFGPPLDGVKEFLAELKQQGYYILVYSCRPKNEAITGAMENYLDKHGLVYDSVFTHGFKPAAIAYIDDRAISCQPQKHGRQAFTDALQSLQELETHKGKEKNQNE